ncbi:MAG: hypothetical protein AAFP77_19695 [Bacteroidota bacterium]
MKLPTTKQFIIATISFFAGVMAMVGYNAYQAAQNEAAEIPAEFNALALSTEYTTHKGFNIMDIINPVVYSVDYNPKNRCRAEYQVWGEIQLSHPQDIHTTVNQKPGTPTGTTVSAESVDRDPAKPLYRVKSNYPMTEEQLLLLYEVPEGWLAGKWINYGVHTIRETCLPPNTAQQAPEKPSK